MASSRPSSTTLGPLDTCRHLLNGVLRHEIVRFLVAGSIAALFNVLAACCYRYLLDRTVLYLEISVAFGFAVGTVVSFVLNRAFTFRVSHGRKSAQALRFALLSVLGVALSGLLARGMLCLIGILPRISGNESLANLVAHVLTIVVMTVFNFVVIKYVAFGVVSSAPDQPPFRVRARSLGR